VQREAIFISHANPKDNIFTLWLGAKLTSLGYEVWADVLRLQGQRPDGENGSPLNPGRSK